MLAARESEAYRLPTGKPRQRRATSPKPRAQAAPLKHSTCAAWVAGIVLCAFLLTHQVNALARLGYEANRLSAELSVLQAQTDELQVTVAGLGSLQRVQQLAESRLTMVRADGSIVLTAAASPPRSTALGASLVSAANPAVLSAVESDGATYGLLERLWLAVVRLARNAAEAGGLGD